MTASTLLLKNATLLCTMNADLTQPDTGGEIANGGIFIRGGIIEQVGNSQDLPQHADRVIDLAGHIVIPGMVNTHHHLFQNLTRVVPAAQNAPLFGWLKTLYPIWQHLGPDHIY
ncbi:MAG: 8-oxoguanine deaminase, partial [Candidatus Puniceispirillaceae bacterium]